MESIQYEEATTAQRFHKEAKSDIIFNLVIPGDFVTLWQENFSP